MSPDASPHPTVEGAPAPAVSDRVEDMLIAFGVDRAFTPHLAATLSSLRACVRKTPVSVLIIHDGMSEAEQARIAAVWPQARFLWRRINDSSMEGLEGRQHISRATFYRLAIPDLAPNGYRRCLYLDSDLVAVSDVTALWQADLAGAPIGAVCDSGMAWKTFAAAYGLDASKGPYFNAGVLVLDLDQIRRERAFEHARDLALRNDFKYLDQDALNILFWGRWKKLDPRWNLQHTVLSNEVAPDVSETDIARGAKPWIVHYTSHRKPWLKDQYHPYAWLYWRALRRTAYAGEVAARQGIPNRAQARLFLRWMKHWPHFG